MSGFNRPTLTTQNVESYGLLTNIGLSTWGDLKRCTNYVAFQDVSFKNYLVIQLNPIQTSFRVTILKANPQKLKFLIIMYNTS